MTPQERAVNCVTLWHSNSPGAFPGRPVLEGRIAAAITTHTDAALAVERLRIGRLVRAEADYQQHLGRVGHAASLYKLADKVESGPNS